NGVATLAGEDTLVAYKAETATLNVSDSSGLDSTNAGGTGATLTVSATTASVLAFTTDPAGATAGRGLPTPAGGKSEGASRKLSTVGLGARQTVTLAINSGPAATLQGTLSYDIGTGAGNGTITGSGLRIDTTGTYTLKATASGLSQGTSGSFTV